MGDDSLGSIVAERLRQRVAADVEVVSTSEAGFHLLDYMLNTIRLVVVDTVVTGSSPPGTIYEFRDTDLKPPSGGSPHYVGLFETLALARRLHLPVAEEVVILAVEAANCFTVGESMQPAIAGAIPALMRMLIARLGTAVSTTTRYCREMEPLQVSDFPC
jgi:hydrogenase maturation protease